LRGKQAAIFLWTRVDLSQAKPVCSDFEIRSEKIPDEDCFESMNCEGLKSNRAIKLVKINFPSIQSDFGDLWICF